MVSFSLSNWAAAADAGVSSNTTIESLPQEQLFGAEVQYFRLRGGEGPNVPREKVEALWGKVLDAAKDAGMNMISFYIPWDFHERTEGQFDFDGDADYPSRNVKNFIELIKHKGFKYILVRPGPYINAEWGHLGYGAVPLWYELRYGDSHMRDSVGRRTKLFSYEDPDFLRKTQLWFKNVYEKVIKTNVGEDQPIRFVQLDNETNFLWQSIFNHDYSANAIRRYREFLRTKYSSIDDLNFHHGRSWQGWADIQPPTVPGYNVSGDRDWYRFQDKTIHVYLGKLRQFWEDLGLREPSVHFTLAESYNAVPDGLLPNYLYRNDNSSDSATGLMTVNLYPKTEGTAGVSLLNAPFKVDHDVIAEESASQYYLGTGRKWVMGPEVQGGWFRGTNVTAEARQQTYLSAIGHGMKAMLVYYFHEGKNWDSDWARQQIQPYYDRLREDPRYRHLLAEQLPDEFWKELQKNVDKNFMVGFKVWEEMTRSRLDAGSLYFDAALDKSGNPREDYEILRNIGKKIISPYSKWLAQADSIQDPVCLLKDVREQVPSRVPGLDSNKMNSDWAAGLIGYALSASVNMKIVHWGINAGSELESCQVIFHQDAGDVGEDLAARLSELVRSGHTVVNVFADSLASRIGAGVPSQNISGSWQRRIDFLGTEKPSTSVPGQKEEFTVLSIPLFEYTLPSGMLAPENGHPDCFPVFRSVARSVNGYGCHIGAGVFYQLGLPLYDIFNSDAYMRGEDIG